jgi:1-phosphofructokinase
MITAVSLNPSVDLTLTIDGFTYGGLNRVLGEQSDAGGKGMNVALAVRRLGVAAACAGFMQEESARTFAGKLAENGAESAFVACPGSARTNVKLRDKKTGLITEINQSGRPVTGEQLAEMEKLIADRAKPGDFMVLAGSLPPGCPVDCYKTLIDIAAGAGCRCVLDADGARFEEGLKAKPFLVKPNRYELELMTGEKLETMADICRAALSIIKKGVSVVAVSLGAEGAFITDGKDSYAAGALEVEVRSTVGAGDSMVAGLTVGFHEGKSLSEAFRMGMACSAAACMTEGTRTFDAHDYERLLPLVEIARISADGRA